MVEITVIEERRKQILKEIRGIRAMRKGSVTEQYLKVKKKGQKEPELKGPYSLYTRKERGKTVGQRLSREDAERFKVEVDAFHCFRSLCDEYAELTGRLGDLERDLSEGSQEKKRQRRPSKKTKR